MSFQYTIEVTNGLSDFHKMVITVMKMSFKKQRKAIVRMSQLETKYLKIKTQTDLKLCRKHKKICSKIYKRERRKYYESLDMKNVLGSKKNFWKTTRPFFV